MVPHSRLTIVALCLALFGMAVAGRPARAGPGRRTESFDRGWKFHLGDVPGGEKPALDVSAWRSLDVPHDWGIEGPAGSDPASMEGPFDRKCPGGSDAGYLNGGTGWYRKTFTLPEAARGQRVFLEFDG